MGGEAHTLAGLAGMGDLIATCMSPLSRNRTLGEQLGSGKSLDEVLSGTRSVAEGVGTAFTSHELAQRYGVEMPVCAEVYKVLAGEIPASEAYRGCCAPSAPATRPSRAEPRGSAGSVQRRQLLVGGQDGAEGVAALGDPVDDPVQREAVGAQ